MQIHEITLSEVAGGAGAFAQMAQQVAPQTPSGPTRSSTQGTTTPTATGLVHTASPWNPNPGRPAPTQQQLWDREYSKIGRAHV